MDPGAALLAKWLPVFFVPSLVALPLADGVGGPAEVAKVAGVVVGGFFFTLFTTAGAVVGVQRLEGKGVEEPALEPKEVADKSAASPPAPPFSDRLLRNLRTTALVSRAATVGLVKQSPGSPWIIPARSLFLLATTLSSFVFGARLPKSFTRAIHPLVTCTAFTWLGTTHLARLAGSTFKTVLGTHKAGTLAPFAAGPGDLLLFLLGPAVVALACQM